MKLAVLDLSYWPPEFMSGAPKFGDELARWLARGLPEAVLPVIDVEGGAAVPSVDGFDGFVISGSDKGVYDDASWMQPVRALLLDARDAGKPLLGVCFGHQIMADVFGGKAEKVSDPVVGVRRFILDGAEVAAHVWHQDQVVQQPPGTEIIAHADYCPLAGLSYDFPALSVQFHPEYEAHYMGSFLRRSRGQVLPAAHTDTALEELRTGDVAPDLFAARAGDFFRDALASQVSLLNPAE